MGKSKKPQMPLYDQYSDNIYQMDNRKLAKGLGDWLNNKYSTIDATSPEFQRAVDSYVGDYNNRVKQSINSNYKPPTNQRLGSMNTGLYNTDMGGLANDDLNRRIDSTNAQQYGSLANQYFNNQLANLAARYMQYVPSGEDINAADYVNNNIINQNKDRDYYNKMIRDQNKSNPWNIVKSAVEGGMKGAQWGGPWGALAGTVAGAGQGVMNEYTDIGWANDGKGVHLIEKIPSKGSVDGAMNFFGG